MLIFKYKTPYCSVYTRSAVELTRVLLQVHFHGAVSADLLATTADKFVELGLDKLGYEYINSDDLWLQLNRSASGALVPAKSFGGPNDFGMRNLSSYIASKGLKLGLYNAASLTTCAKAAGSLYKEIDDAKQFAAWNVSYLKYDQCGQDDVQPYQKYLAMRDALNISGTRFVYSFEPGVGVDTHPARYLPLVGNLYRTGHDIGPYFGAIQGLSFQANQWTNVATRGGWTDPGTLEIGNSNSTFNASEARAQMALWCILKAPLLIGADLSNIGEAFLDILRNQDLIGECRCCPCAARSPRSSHSLAFTLVATLTPQSHHSDQSRSPLAHWTFGSQR